MPTELEFIQGYSPLFSQLLKNGKPLSTPLGATAYYIFLITRFPTNFRTISQEAKKIMGRNINESKLGKGRQDLLELGFISEILPVNGNLEFGREMFLPISPELVWQDNIEKLDGKIDSEAITQRFKLVEELQKIYKINFGEYGVRVEDGSITVFHSSQWLLYYLGNNIKDNKNIRMLLGTLGSFEKPYIKYYEDMLRKGLKTKIICDPAATNDVDLRINNIMKLKEKYAENIDIRASPLSHGTSRLMIYDNMAIDGKKLIDSYLFRWSEIPGNDEERLKNFLSKECDIDWIKNATIEKIDNDKTIKVSSNEKSLSLKLNDERTKVELKSDNNKAIKFIAKMENDALNIYIDSNSDLSYVSTIYFQEPIITRMRNNFDLAFPSCTEIDHSK